jgi:phospholipid transport system transporter-binding protein
VTEQKHTQKLKAELNEELNQIALTGDLVFPCIDGIRKVTEAEISAKAGDCVLDFSNVKKVDSSSLSLCLCFLRLARKQNKKMTFINLPKDMVAIADLVGLSVIGHTPAGG